MGEPSQKEMLVTLTTEELRQLVMDAVSQALIKYTIDKNARVLSVEDAAAQLGITANAMHKRIARGMYVPDVKGGNGTGSRGHGFLQTTIDKYKRGEAA
jgi:hypothetical protein